MTTLLALSPKGHLHLVLSSNTEDLSQSIKAKQVVDGFNRGEMEGLLSLLAVPHYQEWPPSLLYWRHFVADHLHQLCHLDPNTTPVEPIPIPSEEALDQWIINCPPLMGAEYLSKNTLIRIWTAFDCWVRNAVTSLGKGINGFLLHYLPHWHQVGRVCFHLAENRADLEYPFAFMATYASGVGQNARVHHKPLHGALKEYAGKGNKQALVKLLQPIYDASKQCEWVKELMESNDIYHPMAWAPNEAYAFLKSVPLLEENGIVVRLPDWWKKQPRPRVSVSIGNTTKQSFSVNELLDFKIHVALEDQPLTAKERDAILNAETGLISLRGKWVEVNSEKLQEALQHWKKVESEVSEGGVSFVEGMRLLAGTHNNLSENTLEDQNESWSQLHAGGGLKTLLSRLRHPEKLDSPLPHKSLKATLRPYQQVGMGWLHFLTQLGLGACLADDMGLGKTIQIISLLLIKKQEKPTAPSLLVLPASLLSNWKMEIERFAPSLHPLYAHPSETSLKQFEDKTVLQQRLKEADLVLTTYGLLSKQPWLQKQQWHLVILDEAQAIKNPLSNQTKAVKKLKGKSRIALTGTPVENRLGDLWSLFDFLCPGLLGSAAQFKQLIKQCEQPQHAFASLRKLVQPYILRRLKTDKTIINDLPDKTEILRWCSLSKQQAALYEQTVQELTLLLKQESGIKKKGLIVSYLTRFKQICNHPQQGRMDDAYQPQHSGKFMQLQALCEEIASRQEKVLVFTQFKEMTDPLFSFLSSIFGQSGLILHGGTPVKQRQKLVNQFQQEEGPPFFVLSLKAAGVGLNLTEANHVIHFDRWWNPAVENQATDRAFRIGQKRNIMVHKFVCRGTIEEKINEMIEEKSKMASDLLSGEGKEILLTEMDDNALINLVSLDLEKALF